MTNKFDGAGNLFNKYESGNPIVKILMKQFFSDFDSIIFPIKGEITSALEIGCGEGYVTDHVNRMGIQVVGSDVSPRIIRIAREKFPRSSFFEMSIYDPEAVEQHDLIIANEVFEHLYDPDTALENVKKISRKYILISVPHEPFFSIANLIRLQYLRSGGNTPGHVNRWSRREFCIFLKKHHLRVRTMKSSSLWLIALCEK